MPSRDNHSKVCLLAGLILATVVVSTAQTDGQAAVRLYREGNLQVREISGTVRLDPSQPSLPTKVIVQCRLGAIHLHQRTGNVLSYKLRITMAASPVAAATLDTWPVTIVEDGDSFDIVTDAPAIFQAPGRRGATVRFYANGELALDLTLPTSAREIRVDSQVGDITADELSMQALLHTAAGNITAGDVAGALQVSSAAGGNIMIRHSRSLVDAQTRGSIHLDTADGPITLSSQGGNVEVGQAAATAQINTSGGGIDIGSVLGTLVAYSGGGNMRLGTLKGDANLQTTGGKIVAASVQSVQCWTGSGDIDLQSIEGAVKAQTESGRIQADFAPGAHIASSTLRSGLGGIVVILPASLGVALSAEIIDPGNHVVHSEYPDLEAAAKMRSGLLLAQAAVNGGGPSLQLVSTSSDITVRKP